MVVTQAESDFSIDLVEEQAQEPVSNSVPEPTVFVNTSQPNYNYLQTSSVKGHGQSQLEPRMSVPRPGSKRKHTTETSTIVLRHGLFNLKWNNFRGFVNKQVKWGARIFRTNKKR